MWNELEEFKMQSNPGVLEDLVFLVEMGKPKFLSAFCANFMDFQYKFSFYFYLFILDPPQNPFPPPNHFQNSPLKKDKK